MVNSTNRVSTNKNIFKLVDDAFIDMCNACKQYENSVSHVNNINDKLKEYIGVYKGIDTFYECPPVVSAMCEFDESVRALKISKETLDAKSIHYHQMLDMARMVTSCQTT